MNHFIICFSFIFSKLLSFYKRTEKMVFISASISTGTGTVVYKSMGEGILEMRVRFPGLKVLRLQGSRVTADQLVAVRAAMPNCQIEL
jgi:hypothetical protein